ALARRTAPTAASAAARRRGRRGGAGPAASFEPHGAVYAAGSRVTSPDAAGLADDDKESWVNSELGQQNGILRQRLAPWATQAQALQLARLVEPVHDDLHIVHA